MNPIQPITARPREISVAEPVSPALERVKLMLFQPFDLGKWFVIGFCAWLACLGEGGGGGGGGNFGNNFGNHSHETGAEVRHGLEQAWGYVLNHLYWIVPVASLLILLCLALGLLILWLNCRGKFMFLHCVALNQAEVVEPWNKFGREGNSLFWFRVVLGLIGAVLTLPLLATIAVLILRMIFRGEPDVGGIVMAAGLALVFFVLAIVFAILRKFTVDFVVPIMFLRGGKCWAAWKEFYGLLSAHPGQFALYILFQIVLSMAIGVLVLLAILVTCCVAGCLMALPYLGTVLLLPVLIFKRAYPLYYLAQYGPEYDVFPPPATPPMAGTSPLPA
ncbi:MAG TPA: hypothetical protein VN836_06640 [Verrucomicrobiae bacterium]|nr:hypothetical protein [Verrucomicrobiae bacterium]